MNIGIISNKPGSYYSEADVPSDNIFFNLIHTLAKRGHNVDVYIQSLDRKYDMFDPPDNVNIKKVNRFRWYTGNIGNYYHSLKTRFSGNFERYDIIHGSLTPPSAIAFCFFRSIDTPVIVSGVSTAIGSFLHYDTNNISDYIVKYFIHPSNAILDSLSGRAVDHIHSISSVMTEDLIKYYGLNSNKISTVTPGVDTERFYPREKNHPDISEDLFTILFVGGLRPIKNPEFAIKCLLQLDVEKFELVVAGGGRERERLMNISSKKGISHRVKLLGHIPQEKSLPLLFSSADILIFSSKYEGFGLSLLEAMASGTPVIGHPVGGVPDLVTNAKNGYIEDSVSGYVNRIRELEKNRNKLQHMSNNALEVAESNTWEEFTKDITRLYKETA